MASMYGTLEGGNAYFTSEGDKRSYIDDMRRRLNSASTPYNKEYWDPKLAQYEQVQVKDAPKAAVPAPKTPTAPVGIATNPPPPGTMGGTGVPGSGTATAPGTIGTSLSGLGVPGGGGTSGGGVPMPPSIAGMDAGMPTGSVGESQPGQLRALGMRRPPMSMQALSRKAY